MTEALEARQEELQQKSKAVRAKQQSRNARNQRKQKEPRLRVSVTTILKLLAQDAGVIGRDRVEACKLLLVLDGKLPVEIFKVDKEPERTAPPVSSGNFLEPAKSY